MVYNNMFKEYDYVFYKVEQRTQCYVIRSTSVEQSNIRENFSNVIEFGKFRPFLNKWRIVKPISNIYEDEARKLVKSAIKKLKGRNYE